MNRRRRVTRSLAGDLGILFILVLGAVFMAMPLVLTLSNAFKPLSELFIFPPQFFVRNPTLDNFRELLILMSQSWVPMSRYFFNTLLISLTGTLGHVFLASLAAYVLAKHTFPGRDIFFGVVVLSLMFARQVTAIPNYLIMSQLGFIDTHFSVVIPAWAMPLGLYLMKQFMGQVHDSLLEAARLDGAHEFRIFWQIVLPMVKPAWLTLIILSFQALWAETGARFIYSEQLKTLPYALGQIISGGIARAGVGAAVTLIMMIIPITVFVVNQSKVVQTMGTAGIDK